MSQLYSLFREKAFENPNKIAIATINGNTIIYKDLLQLVDIIAFNLKINIKPPQSKIALHLDNSIELFAISIAISKLNLIAIPLITSLIPEQVRLALISTGTDLLITSNHFFLKFTDLASSIFPKHFVKVLKI